MNGLILMILITALVNALAGIRDHPEVMRWTVPAYWLLVATYWTMKMGG